MLRIVIGLLLARCRVSVLLNGKSYLSINTSGQPIVFAPDPIKSGDCNKFGVYKLAHRGASGKQGARRSQQGFGGANMSLSDDLRRPNFWQSKLMCSGTQAMSWPLAFMEN